MAAQYDDSQAEAEEDEENTFDFVSHLSGTLCVLDCSEDMTSKDPQTGISSIVLSLEAIKSTYCNKLISGSRDYLGVVLCGVDSKTNDYPGLHVLLPLDIPDKSCVGVLERAVADFTKGTFQFGHSQSYSSYHLLWTCNSIFTSCIKKLGNRTAMIFTNVPEPLNLDKKTRQLAVTKARDMSELGISISVITLPTADGSQFDMEKFYSAIVPDQELLSPTNDIEDLTMRVHRRQSKVSFLKNINFVVSVDMTVGIELARLYGDTPSRSVNLCSKTNEPVLRISTTVRQADRTVLLPHEVYSSVKCGTETVLFSKDERDQMKIRAAKGLYLIGFQPASKVKMHHVAGKSMFVRPCDRVYTGSSEFLSALLERLSAREMVAMCHCVPTEGSTGFIGALVPQKEVRDDNNEQVKPAGFNLLQLPYAEHVRKLDYLPVPPPSTQQVDAAKAMILKLKAKYNSNMIEDPEVQTFNKTLEAIALEKDSVEEVEDLAKPDVARMDKRAGKEMKDFREAAFKPGYGIPEECKKPDYRKVNSMVMNKHREGKLDGVLVANLRLFAKGAKINISSTAKKADLLLAIRKFLG